MRHSKIAAALALALLIGVSGANSQTPGTQPAPASAYGRLPAITHAAVSADGTKIAMLREIGGQMGIDVIDAKTLAHIAVKPTSPEVTFRAVNWSPDGRLLVFATQTFNPVKHLEQTGSIVGVRTTDARGAYEYERIVAMPVEGAGAVTLLRNVDNRTFMTSLADYWPAGPDQPGSVLMTYYAATYGGWQPEIQRVDLNTGVGVRQTMGTVNTSTFIVDGVGKVVGRVDRNPARTEWTLLSNQGGSLHEIMREKSEFGESPIAGIPFFDGRFAMTQRRDRDQQALYSIDPADGKVSLAFADPRYDVTGDEYDPWTREIVGVTVIADLPTQHFIDPAIEAIRVKVAALFADGYATLDPWDKNRTVFTVLASHGGAPMTAYIYRPADNSLTPLLSSYPELRNAPIGRRLSLTYKSRDGLPIPAYLTLPEGAQMKGFPLVVLPHGGPTARDDARFDFIAGFLASRGYAVLQPNFRGSDGYGYSWRQAGYGGWGGAMQNDLSDGVGAMIKAGITDANHVCIVGISYGGYAALAGATLTPDLYRCAISVGGIGDLNLYVDRKEERTDQYSTTRYYMRASVGAGVDDRKLLLPISPIEHVDAVKAPILIMHAEQDTVVPIDQSKRMYAKLTGAGKNARFVDLPGDDHWLSYGPTRTQMLEEMDKFLATNLKAAPAAP